MRILIVTPNEPFYLAKNIDYLLKNISIEDEVVGCVLLSPTPHGKRLNFLEKAYKTLSIFGLSFFIYYSMKYIITLMFSNDVRKTLKNHQIPILKLNENINNIKSITTLNKYNPDIIISILGNEIFKDPILNLPKLGCINLHTSLLPKYRGMMPTFWAMLNDEKEIGVSVFLMDKGIDTGPIIVQKNTPITNTDSQKSLIERTKRIGMQLIIKSLELIKDDNLKYIKNSDRDSSYYSYPKREDVKLFLKKGNKFF